MSIQPVAVIKPTSVAYIEGQKSSFFSITTVKKVCTQVAASVKGAVKYGVYYQLLFGACVVAHEHSHMLAMRVLFEDVDPYMSCDFSKAMCRAHWNGLGQVLRYPKLGQLFSRGLVSAAGPSTDLISIACASIIYFKLRSVHLKTATTIAAFSFLYSLDLFLYCITTENRGWGDFAQIEAFLGIPHESQTAFLFGVTVATFSIMLYSFGYAYLNRNKPVDQLQVQTNWKRMKLVMI